MKVLSARFLLTTTALIASILFNGVVARAASAAISAGQLVTLTATADGTAPFTYQWYKDGNALTGATNSTYTLSSFQAANSGTYTTVVSNSAGSTTTDDAVLTLAVANVLPVFTTQPTGQTVTAGTGVNFTAAASGTPSPTFQWQKNGANISGATGTSYNLSSTVMGDAGSYTVIATNAAGATTSGTANLTVNALTVAPVITTQPTSQTVTAGGSVTFTAAASGTPAPTFQWQKNSVIIIGATSASYTLPSTVMGDAGSYTVVATNSVSAVTSNAASLTVNAPTAAPAFTTQPISQTVTAGGSVTFTAAASGNPAPTLQWNKNGVAIIGATGASYVLLNTVVGDSGSSYTVVATNSVSAVTSNAASLTVNAATSVPVFITQPASQTVTAGGAVTFTAAANGNPSPTYQWRKNGTAISGATSTSYTLSSTVAGDAGSYAVVATNSAGAVASSSVSLTVNAAAVAPTITTQPSSQTATVGGSVTFSATASGTPAPTYQWKKDGVDIIGATSASYTRASLITTSAGTYTVVVTNSAGAVTSSGAMLTINSSPTFTTQPASQTVVTGSAVTFTASASGSPSPTFQWKKGGSAITGATSASYTISSSTAGNAGSYTVVATNSVGAVTSNTATLTVNAAPAAPVFTTQPASQTVIGGGAVTFTVAASGTPTPTFQWKKDGVDIAGATSASYIISVTTTADSASYTVVATNTVSAATSTAATLSVLVPPKNLVVSVTIQ